MRFKPLSTVFLLFLLCISANAQTLENALIPVWNRSIGTVSQEVESNLIFMGVEDINNDGHGEIVAVLGGSVKSDDPSRWNMVYCFSENGTLLWNRASENKINHAALYDTNRDRQVETILATGQSIQKISRGGAEFIRSDGTKTHTIQLGGIVRTITISDLGGDRYPELIGASRNTVYVFDKLGTSLWNYSVSGTPPPDPEIIVDDIMFDSRKEVVVGGYNINVLNYSGKDDFGPLSIEEVSGRKGDRVDKLAVGNVLSEGSKQLLFSTQRSDLLYLYHLGREKKRSKNYVFKELWSYPLAGEITALKVFDIDGDNRQEILFSDENEALYVLEGDGNVKWSFKVYGRVTDIEVADVDGDYTLEVVLVSTSGVIQVLDAIDGTLIWEHNVLEPLAWVSVKTIDLDEINEVIVGTIRRNIHVFSLNETYTEMFSAHSYYARAQNYFRDGRYNESLQYLQKAKRIYLKYNSRADVLRANELIKTIEETIFKARREMADAYYDKAVQFFIDEDYKQAKAYALDSKRLYEEFWDSRNALKAELLLIRIEDKISDSGSATTSVSKNETATVSESNTKTIYIILFVLVLVITILLLNQAYQRKRAVSKVESKEVKEYEKRLERIIDEDIDEISKIR